MPAVTHLCGQGDLTVAGHLRRHRCHGHIIRSNRFVVWINPTSCVGDPPGEARLPHGDARHARPLGAPHAHRARVARPSRNSQPAPPHNTQQRWDTAQAETYLSEIEIAIEHTAADPARGRPCDEVRPGYRRYAIGSHLVYYRATPDSVDVIRILHQRMDPTRHFSRRMRSVSPPGSTGCRYRVRLVAGPPGGSYVWEHGPGDHTLTVDPVRARCGRAPGWRPGHRLVARCRDLPDLPAVLVGQRRRRPR
ncbi:MAG: type II toxin-antitoxin system RelE/ParE family toxin [Dermatophilaceae bacterium]